MNTSLLLPLVRIFLFRATFGATLLPMSFASAATQLDETISGTVVHILNRTGLPANVDVGDSFVAHIYIDTGLAPTGAPGGTYTTIWSDISPFVLSGGGPQWVEFSLAFNGSTFYDSRTTGYVDGDNRAMKVLDQPNAVINGQQAFTDIYTVDSTKTTADRSSASISLDSSTRSLTVGHYFLTSDLGEAFSAPADLNFGSLNFSEGPVGRTFNVDMTVDSLSSLAVGGSVPAVPEPSTVLLMLTSLGVVVATRLRTRHRLS